MEELAADHSPLATRYSPTSLLRHCSRRIEWAERFIAGDLGEDLIIVPRIFRFFRLLDLYQPQVMHHQIDLAQFAVAGEEILDRLFADLRRHFQRLVGAGRLDGGGV